MAIAHAEALRRVASDTLDDARAAWKASRTSTTEDSVRSAFRACVLASRSLRKAAKVTPDEAEEMLAAAERVDAAADRLKVQLVRIVEPLARRAS